MNESCIIVDAEPWERAAYLKRAMADAGPNWATRPRM